MKYHNPHYGQLIQASKSGNVCMSREHHTALQTMPDTYLRNIVAESVCANKSEIVFFFADELGKPAEFFRDFEDNYACLAADSGSLDVLRYLIETFKITPGWGLRYSMRHSKHSQITEYLRQLDGQFFNNEIAVVVHFRLPHET